MSFTMTDSGLPDPATQPEFYENVPTKRLLAWLVDIVVIALFSAVAATLPLFVGWFFFPLVFLVLSFIYRVSTITRGSATWGMRLFNIELRNREGAPLDTAEALIHTSAYMVASGFFFPQVISVVLMLGSERRQGLHDMLCGTAAINRPSRYS